MQSILLLCIYNCDPMGVRFWTILTNINQIFSFSQLDLLGIILCWMSVIGKVLLGDNATESKEDNLMQSSDFNHVSSTTKKRVKTMGQYLNTGPRTRLLSSSAWHFLGTAQTCIMGMSSMGTWASTIGKHEVNIVMNLNICKSQGVGGDGSHKIPPTLKECA